MNPLTRFARPARRLTLLLGVLASVIGTIVASPAGAHTGDQSYLYLDVTEDALGGRVELPFTDLRRFFGLTLEGTPEEQVAELEANRDLLFAFADEHLLLGAGGAVWPVEFTEVGFLNEKADDPDFGYALLQFQADVGADPVPRELEVTFDPFFDELPNERDALLLIGNDWGGGIIENSEEVLLRFAPGSRSQTVDLGDASWTSNFGASFALGLDHIRTGPDHILFVLVLVLPSVLVFNGTWKPVSGFAPALWRVLKVVTMFTVAHTITFTLAGLDLIPLPGPRLVETVIALSIAAAALHNLRPVAVNREWLIAFAFGLFHGLGFASLIAGLEVSRSTQLISLLGRNVGIEVGQAVVVLVTFPALYVLRRTRWYRPFFVVGSLALVVISLGWMTERLFGAPEVTSSLVDAAMAFPRVLGLLAVFTAVSAAAFVMGRRNDTLIPVAGEAPAARAQVDAIAVPTR